MERDVPGAAVGFRPPARVDTSGKMPPCVTVTACPAMIMAPARGAPVSAATVYPTVPLPLPDAPEVIVIHGTSLTAVQLQPEPAVIGMVPAPPPAATEAPVRFEIDTQLVVKDHGADSLAPRLFLAPIAQ